MVKGGRFFMKAFLKDNRTGEDTPFKTEIEYERRENGLFFAFDCENSKLFSACDEDNAPIYKGDVAEVFICACGDRRKYFELEVAPNGKVFFAKILNKDGIHIELLNPKSIKAEAFLRENGYSVNIFVPNEVIGVKKFGEVVFNAFRIETEGGEPEKNLLALSPTLCGTFHMPQFFIDIDK